MTEVIHDAQLWYALNGVKSMFEAPLAVAECINLEADGRRIAIPSDLQAVIIMNVPSYAGGAKLWGTVSEEEAHKVCLRYLSLCLPLAASIAMCTLFFFFSFLFFGNLLCCSSSLRLSMMD